MKKVPTKRGTLRMRRERAIRKALRRNRLCVLVLFLEMMALAVVAVQFSLLPLELLAGTVATGAAQTAATNRSAQSAKPLSADTLLPTFKSTVAEELGAGLYPTNPPAEPEISAAVAPQLAGADATDHDPNLAALLECIQHGIRPKYAALSLSESDIKLLGQMVLRESGIDDFNGQVMAVEATVNRLLHPWYPDTVHEVLYQVFNGRYEYTSAPLLASAEPTAEHYEAVHAALCGPGVLPDALPDGRTAVFFGREPQNQYIAATSRFHTFCYEYPTR